MQVTRLGQIQNHRRESTCLPLRRKAHTTTARRHVVGRYRPAIMANFAFASIFGIVLDTLLREGRNNEYQASNKRAARAARRQSFSLLSRFRAFVNFNLLDNSTIGEMAEEKDVQTS